ncbi:MAG: hypothetical protein GX361_05835 [Bacteroidales bacterium]|nr:hypothetical protein [Bacteroidales bacterium]
MNSKKKAIQAFKKKAPKLPVSFIVGAVIGGGLFLYASRNKRTKTLNAVTNVAKLAAPYVIIAILDKMVDNYEAEKGNAVEETEAEII